MILENILREVVTAQKRARSGRGKELLRDRLQTLPKLQSHALIVSGIRRCGKSTLLFQLLEEQYPDAFFLNFEDPRLYGFEPNDFSRLDSLIDSFETKVLFFDELQIIDGWERFVRQKLDQNFQVIITGSNAALLSGELGTKLTGRHISIELFPFSFHEFCTFKKVDPTPKAVEQYLLTGGFPEYVKRADSRILHTLFEDILLRDIAVRYGVRDIKSLQKVALYLISNIGKPVTANRMKSLFEVSATSTMMEYFSHLEMAYLFFFIPKFSYSIRKQLINPRKVYAIDTGLICENSTSFSKDRGRKFENLVFLHLRQNFKEIYYFNEKGECDFVVFEKGNFREAIQVCMQLTPDNLERELNGLFEALEFFNQTHGTLVTWNEKDTYEKNGKKISIVPAHEFFNS